MLRFPFAKKRVIGAGLLVSPTLIGALAFFPWDTDNAVAAAGAKDYFKDVYSDAGQAQTESPPVIGYPAPEAVREAQVKSGIPGKLDRWMANLHLRDGKVLEVGAGHGFLQDLVADYTGLDISSSARRFFHKPFVEASATAMPFPDGHFDAVWSIWVLEHIPDPEQALLEMRRVVKPGGYLLLEPAYEVSRFAASGYPVRKYSELDWSGALSKALVVPLESRPLSLVYRPGIDFARYTAGLFGPTRLRFSRLNPNYSRFWMSDSDAAVSFTHQELMLWFRSRGDECRSCPLGPVGSMFGYYDPMIVVRKQNSGENATRISRR